ncbi:condensation domain-containing protein [Spongiactinospora sp. 9N601]|uniref:condensation domain-containing protein n=1 Tax=Spongiactinospora sp. 9N601 TaxID=3375149 RepID=UPI0037A24411
MNARIDTAVAAPLSCGQERLWFLSRLAPRSTAYLLAARFQVLGPLDPGLLGDAVSEVMLRHHVLATAFATRAGRPVQIVTDPCASPFRVVDLSHLGEREREQEWERLSRDEATRPYDLATAPLFRFTVARMEERRHRLCVSMHHIVSDKASIDIMLREIAEIYRARLRGERARLDPPPLQYADFARRQREWLAGSECVEQMAYWRDRLAGAPARMPLGGARPPAGDGRGPATGEPLALARDTQAGLREFAERERVSTFMVLLSAYALALGRCHDLSDIIIACPVTNRPTLDTQRLVGFFVNTLPIRITLRPGMSFRQLTAQVRATVFGALEHQDLPFDRIVSALRPARRPGEPPFFQAVLNFVAHDDARLGLPGLEVAELPGHRMAARAELALDVEENRRAGSLTGNLLYDPGVREPGAMARLMASLRTVLETALTSPDRPVG